MASTAEILGTRLRQLRLRAGLTTEQLADLAGYERAELSKVEVGRHVPKLQTLIDLAQALEVRLFDLLLPLDRDALGSAGWDIDLVRQENAIGIAHRRRASLSRIARVRLARREAAE